MFRKKNMKNKKGSIKFQPLLKTFSASVIAGSLDVARPSCALFAAIFSIMTGGGVVTCDSHVTHMSRINYIFIIIIKICGSHARRCVSNTHFTFCFHLSRSNAILLSVYWSWVGYNYPCKQF